MTAKTKILVLSDLRGKTPMLLKSAITLAKIVDGELEFFHVKKPTELVKTASQLSAVREINASTKQAKKKIKELLDPISKKYNIKVNYRYSFGNVKSEIEKYIRKTKPDIIVLGKRKTNSLSFIGDNIIDFVLKSHKGAILIASHNNSLDPENELAVGLFNAKESSIKNSVVEELINNSKLPLRSFKIGIKDDDKGHEDKVLSKETIEYVFEDTADVISNISSYIPKSKVNLLCANRDDKTKRGKTINAIIRKVKVSVFVT